MSGALNGSAVRVTRTPPAVTDSVCSAAGAWLACAAGSACPAGSTCAPWVRARNRDAKSDRRYRAVASGCAAREPVTASSAAPPLVRGGSHAGSLPGAAQARHHAQRCPLILDLDVVVDFGDAGGRPGGGDGLVVLAPGTHDSRQGHGPRGGGDRQPISVQPGAACERAA